MHHLLDVAARRLPLAGGADHAAALVRLASAPSCPPPWQTALCRAAEIVALRRAFLKEIR
jgi:hypothetical protein